LAEKRSGDGAGGAWERIRSEELLETPYFTLRSDGLRLPDGSVKDPYFVLERPDAAIIFPLTREGEVVLVRQYRPPLERMELGLPAGLVEEGEEPETAARRELAEETGYSGGEWEPLGALASSPSLKDNWAYLFLARGVEQTAAPDPDEHELVETVKVPVEELLGLIQAQEIVSSSGVAAVMLALERLRGARAAGRGARP
jgi:ADP-ribose pyrophosphatase